MTLPSYVGRYEVRREIATGGFAVVLEAWDEELDSLVAIKVLHEDLARDQDIQSRFLEEARLLRRIRSPHVVTVHDVGRLNDGRPYFVMDFADRGTLVRRLGTSSARPAPDYKGIGALVDAVADGLSAIHQAGIVHRDIKPANILFQLSQRAPAGGDLARAEETAGPPKLVEVDERILVGDLGIAKDLLKRARDETIIGGTPLYQAPEQDDPAAEVTPSADVYAATAMLWHVLSGERPPAARGVQSRLATLPDPWAAVIEQGMATDPDRRFERMEDWRAAINEALAHEASDVQERLPTESAQTSGTCPYKGLAPYQPEDAQAFHGRESLIDELVRRLQLNQVLVVGGPSGAGKSSLVRAGLIPALNAGALPGSEAWRVALFTPGRDPIAELYYQVTKLAPSGQSAISLEDLVAHPTIARHLGGTDDADQTLLLCIDQFEELFTLAPAAQRRKFVEALSAMTDPADSKVRVVIAVRADFYGACAQLPWLAERITDNQVLVGPMTGPELRRAISEPARPAGLFLERGLADAIIAEAGEEAGSLPLVAHALVETWQRRQGNMLTLEGFHSAGGVAGAISQTADATFEDRFDDTERAATKRLFLRLVTPGEGTPDTRRLLPISEIDNDTDPTVMHRVVERLTDVRLLTVDDTNVQIAHEALLRTWPRLRVWIEESRDDLRMRQRISRAAREWDAEGKDSDLLYRGTPLLSALEWVARNPDQLEELEREFVDASAEMRDMAEALAAERARRTRRVRRTAVALLSFLALGTTAASIAAFMAFREADQNKVRAEMATAEARERFAGALGSAAFGLVDTDPLLALVLGAEATARAETEPPAFDARASLIASRRSLAKGGPFVLGSPARADDALAITMSADGALLAVAKRDGAIDLVDTATRRQIGPSLRGHRGGVRDVEFGPRGRRLASVGADGTIRLWTIDGGLGGRGKKIGQTADVVSGVSFSPGGTAVASANGDGTVRLWDAAKGAPIGAPLIKRTLGFKVIEYSPDGRGLVAGYNDGSVYGWKLPTGEQLFPPIEDAHASNLSTIVFSPTGNRFATASTDGTSIVFEYPSGRKIGHAFGPDARINTVVFSRDGRILIGGGVDGTVRLWDIETRKTIRSTPAGHSKAIVDAELSRDGRLLVTLGEDQLVRFWKFGGEPSVAAVRSVRGASAKGVAFSGDGRRLAAGDDTGVVQVWELGGGKDPVVLRGHGHQVWAVGFSPDGGVLASGDRSGHVRLWDPASGRLTRSIATQDGPIWSIGFNSDGSKLVTTSDTNARLWDAATGSLLKTLGYGGGRATRSALSPDGSYLALATTDGKIGLWTIEDGQRVKEITVDDDVVWSVAFSPDGRRLATASSDEVVAVWDVASGKQLASFTGHTGGATDVAYLADGVTIIAVDRTGMLHFWDAKSGRPLSRAWRGHAAASWRIAVHPDGVRFVTSGDDGFVKVWDELSVTRACEIGKPAFDAVRHRQYLGEGEHSVACDRTGR